MGARGAVRKENHEVLLHVQAVPRICHTSLQVVQAP